MDSWKRLALAVRTGVAEIRGREARLRSSLLERRDRTAMDAVSAQATLDAAMGGYSGTISEWVGCTEQGLRRAVRVALNDYE
jgi:hypothetical protein